MQIHFLLNIKTLLVPYNKLSLHVVYVNYESNIETSKCNIYFKAKKKTSLSLNILNLYFIYVNYKSNNQASKCNLF